MRVVDLGAPLDCYVSNGRERIMATLNLVQRALTSTLGNEPIPNIEFPISYDDMPTRSTPGVSWGFTRRKQGEENVWLLPDYGFWSWWMVGLPSFRTVWRQMKVLESNLSWNEKIPKAVWRGTPGLNPGIRGKLIEVTRESLWADIKAVHGGEQDADFLTLDAHCK